MRRRSAQPAASQRSTRWRTVRSPSRPASRTTGGRQPAQQDREHVERAAYCSPTNRSAARSRAVASGPACHGRAREACGVSSSVTGATALAPDTAQFGSQPGELPGLPAAPLAGAIDRTSADATAPLPGRRVVGIGGVEAVTVLAAVLGRIAVTRRRPTDLRPAKAVARDQAAQLRAAACRPTRRRTGRYGPRRPGTRPVRGRCGRWRWPRRSPCSVSSKNGS